jgi:hypothetical protein
MELYPEGSWQRKQRSQGVVRRSENQLQAVFGNVGSFYPLRENFRLTEEVKQKFTEKLRSDPTDSSGSKVARIVRTDGLKLILADGNQWCASMARRAVRMGLRS